MTAKVTATFVLEKPTKGAIRYQETASDGTKVSIGDGAKIGTLYIRKTALDGDQPQKIRVEVFTD